MFSIKKPEFIVFEDNGVTIRGFPVKHVKAYNDGFVYIYEKDNKLERVYAGRKYRGRRLYNSTIIGKQAGNNSAAVLFQTEDGPIPQAVQLIGPSTDPDCPGEDLSSLVYSDIAGTGARTVYRKAQIPWKLIIIIAICAIGIFLIYKFAPGIINNFSCGSLPPPTGA